MPECPCCSQKLLRHFRHGRVYWFCSHCWQEMPNLSDLVLEAATRARSEQVVALVGL
jgi:ribosomal protein L37AE/L43A